MGLAVAAKDGVGGEKFCLNAATTSRTVTAESSQVSLTTVVNAEDSLTALHHVQTEMDKKQREILTLQNEFQRSKTLKEEMDSKQGDFLALQDKLQGTKTELLDFQNPSKEKFEEQRKVLESSKSKMEGYTDEKVNLKVTNAGNASFFRDWTYQRKFYSVSRIEFQFRYYGKTAGATA